MGERRFTSPGVGGGGERSAEGFTGREMSLLATAALRLLFDLDVEDPCSLDLVDPFRLFSSLIRRFLMDATATAPGAPDMRALGGLKLALEERLPAGALRAMRPPGSCM